MSFWDRWQRWLNGPPSSSTLVWENPDPDWQERCRLREEQRRLEKHRDLLELEESNIELARQLRKLEDRKRLREENRG